VADVAVDRVVEAAPVVLYDLVSDVTRMGEWSPETTSCRWTRGGTGPVVGAQFRGKNRRGWFRWTTTCRVLVADPGSHFTFDVRFGPIPMARWDYRFVPEEGGCRVTESWTEHRPRWVSRLDPVVFRIADRGRHNRDTMEVTLSRIAERAEKLA
jgi:hypothetical protein